MLLGRVEKGLLPPFSPFLDNGNSIMTCSGVKGNKVKRRAGKWRRDCGGWVRKAFTLVSCAQRYR